MSDQGLTIHPVDPPKPELGERHSWRRVMLNVAIAVAGRSRDATTRVGAVIATPGHRIVGTGFNGGPAGSRPGLPNAGKARHAFVIHAEENAILQATVTLNAIRIEGCVLYATHRPCADCVKRVSHVGISTIWFLADELSEEQRTMAAIIETELSVGVFEVKL